ncbi:MAG: VOC family protein [Hyphomicrobium sp.]
MTALPPPSGARMITCLAYRDADRMVDWLCDAFGFEKHAVFAGEDGLLVHAELTFSNSMIMIGPENKGDFGKTHMTMPDRAGGRTTQIVYTIVEDVDAHHARSAAAGAEILRPLKDEDYGGRDYVARDPEGHMWSFGTYDPWSTEPKA